MENIWPKIEHMPRKEVLKTPEIFVSKEDDAQLLSVILKIKNKEWGNSDNNIASDVEKYFQNNSLDLVVSSFFDEIEALKDGGVDEETLYILALTKDHEERDSGAFSVITKHKNHIKNHNQLQQKLFESLELFKKQFSSSSVFKEIETFIEEDLGKRENNLDKTREHIISSIDFFKPDSQTTKINKVSLIPTDPLYKKDSGCAFIFDNELVLKTHIDNVDNLDHEFSHCIINPIVEKLSSRLSDAQKDKISELANEKLKQDYGSEYFSLLCEELIRTYNDIFKKGERPQTIEEFRQKILTLDDDMFQNLLNENSGLRKRFEQLNISNLVDLKENAEKYFNKFEKNQLRDIIFNLYQEYSTSTSRDDVNFENFILKRLPEVI